MIENTQREAWKSGVIVGMKRLRSPRGSIDRMPFAIPTMRVDRSGLAPGLAVSTGRVSDGIQH